MLIIFINLRWPLVRDVRAIYLSYFMILFMRYLLLNPWLRFSHVCFDCLHSSLHFLCWYLKSHDVTIQYNPLLKYLALFSFHYFRWNCQQIVFVEQTKFCQVVYPFAQPWTLLTLRKNILLKAVNSKLYTLSKTEGFLEQFSSKKSKKNGGKKRLLFQCGW